MTAPIVLNPFGGPFGNLAAVGSMLMTVVAMVAICSAGYLARQPFAPPMRRAVSVGLITLVFAGMAGIVSQAVILIDSCKYTWELLVWMCW